MVGVVHPCAARSPQARHLTPSPRRAVELARANGAAAIEGYPLDNKGAKIDTTMAYVGTIALFEKAGFVRATNTDSVLNGFPRVLMRLDLR